MMDVTSYLETYHMTARELAKTMILDVLHTTGITATAGRRNESLPLQGRHGHYGEARPAGQRRRPHRGA